MDVFLKEGGNGNLMLVDGKGDIVGLQKISIINQGTDQMTSVTVEFLLQPQNQMYKGEENGTK